MANKRIFKKYVTGVSTSMVNDMMTVTYSFDNIDTEAVDKAIIAVLSAGEAAIMKTNVKFDKSLRGFENPALYHKAKARFFRDLYKKVNTEFVKALQDALTTFNAAVPEDVRKSLKAEACD